MTAQGKEVPRLEILPVGDGKALGLFLYEGDDRSLLFASHNMSEVCDAMNRLMRALFAAYIAGVRSTI